MKNDKSKKSTCPQDTARTRSEYKLRRARAVHTSWEAPPHPADAPVRMLDKAEVLRRVGVTYPHCGNGCGPATSPYRGPSAARLTG
jgi:hypothetical protein